MPRFAQVAVNVPGVQDVFDYSIPSDFAGLISPGGLVEVPVIANGPGHHPSNKKHQRCAADPFN